MLFRSEKAVNEAETQQAPDPCFRENDGVGPDNKIVSTFVSEIGFSFGVAIPFL